MNDKVYQQALERSQGGLCEYEGCNSNYMVQLHHIVGGSGKRVQCERLESVIFLCYDHHYGTELGIHGKNGHELILKLRLELQSKYYDMGMSEATIRRWMGGKTY